MAGLFIRMAQHKHAGRYECLVKTPIDIDRAEAMLTVNGNYMCSFASFLFLYCSCASASTALCSF
jgi:hypothetical protein